MTFELDDLPPPSHAAVRTLAPIVALHCSGADGSQWRKLAAAFGPHVELHTPTFIGCGDRGAWHGRNVFTLLDEAQAILDIVDAAAEPVHLVGHSYGGAVALQIAALRPERTASLSLYEPSAFHVLGQLGGRAAAELAEIEELSASVSYGLVSGAYHAAAEVFVDYWSGPGAWSALRPSLRDDMSRWLPKAPLDFRALLYDWTPLGNYRCIACPALLMRGEHARSPSRVIVEEIARLLPDSRLEVVAGAGHMGPTTHAGLVASRIVDHVRAASRPRSEPRVHASIAA